MMKKWGIFILSEVAALIMLQTLFFKFTGAKESIYIFSTLGMEPWGRWGSGAAELVASVLISYPPTRAFGALMAAGIMGGAIASHLFVLGIDIQGDGGLLFSLALVTLLCSLIVLWFKRADLLKFVSKSVA